MTAPPHLPVHDLSVVNACRTGLGADDISGHYCPASSVADDERLGGLAPVEV